MASRFDQVIDRRGTESIKWSCVPAGGDGISLGWADMDFASPQPVIEALTQYAQGGMYGYVDADESWYEAFTGWCARRYSWQVERDWVLYTSGVMPAVTAAIEACTAPGDQVLLQPPTFGPFVERIEKNGRVVLENPLREENGRFVMDYEDLERKAADPKTTLLILSNPQNPVGRVWLPEELTRLGEICQRNGVLVVSDEIHCDFIYTPHRHTPYASLGDAFAQNCIACLAPSKTFNLAGLQTALTVIPNQQLRERIREELFRQYIKRPNLFGMAAAKAAYLHGDQWLDECIDYVAGNLALTEEFLAREIPAIRPIHPEGTFLLWLDCRQLGIKNPELTRFFQEKAHLFFSSGTEYVSQGDYCLRLNLAYPRSVIQEVLTRMAQAVNNR